MQHRILVCGGRTYGVLPPNPTAKEFIQATAERRILTKTLDKILLKTEIECIIQGGAKGADRLGKEWANLNNIPCEEYKANWNKHGRAAGIIRNQEMLTEAKPTVAVVCPGGNGTADMVRRLKAAGIPLVEIRF